MTTYHPALSRLGPGQYLKVDGSAGQTLAVFDGLVWVTQAGDPRDAFVAPGDAFTFDRPGLALVEALSDSRLALLSAIVEDETENELVAA